MTQDEERLQAAGERQNFSANLIEIVFKMMSVGATQKKTKKILLQRSFFVLCGRNRRLLRVLDWFAKEDHYQMIINEIEIKLLINDEKLIENFQLSVEIVV